MKIKSVIIKLFFYIIKKTGINIYKLKPSRKRFGGIVRKELPSKSKSREKLEAINPNFFQSAVKSVEQVHEMNKFNLSVIIPVYNAQKYLKQCLESVTTAIKAAPEYFVQLIVINDGSTDDSLKIINEFSNYDFMTIINQRNIGFSGARNTGLKESAGEYVMFVDADDCLSVKSIGKLLKVGFENGLDVVEGNYDKLKHGFKYGGTDHIDNLNENISKLFGFPWGKVIKRSYFTNIEFPKDCWFEDSIISYLIFSQIHTAGTISEIVYHYRVNNKGISATSHGQTKSIDTFWVFEGMLSDLNKLNIPLNQYLINLFFSQICLNYVRTYELKSTEKKAIFVLTEELVDKYIIKLEVPCKWDKLYVSLKESDYSSYKYECSVNGFI